MLSCAPGGPVRTCVRSVQRQAAWICWLGLTAACGGAGSAQKDSASSAAASGDRDAALSAAAGASAGGHAGAAAAIPATTGDDKTPLTAAQATSAIRKVKGILTGQAITDAEVARVMSEGQAGIKALVRSYMEDSATSGAFRDKLLFFFRNAFQQTGFLPTEDFQNQLLPNGAFDFMGGQRALGDDAFPRLVQNLEDSFAITAWQIVQEGRPFTDVLTTQRFMLTTALKSLYLQIEAPNDRAFGRAAASADVVSWKIDYSGNAIPIEQTLDPTSPNYMVFDDQPPVAPAMMLGNGMTERQTCAAGSGVDAMGVAISSATFTGQSRLFQRLLGQTPRFTQDNMPVCYEHASRPYFSQQDLSDWQWVTIRALSTGETRPLAYDLPRLRMLKELPLSLPRIGYYTTPAFLAIWNTNDSNQHRVTANQTLLVAYGSSYTSASAIFPLSTAGLDAAHAVDGSECYGCHVGLDPLRAFWGNQFDFNDRNDFPARGTRMTAKNPRPATQGGVLAFLDMNAQGANMLELGGLLARATDQFGSDPLNAFAVELTQKLCFFSNSVACDKSDPEFRRIVRAFQDKSFDLRVLIAELFSSPLITGVKPTKTFQMEPMPLSITRRDHLCAALSQRLGKPDICALSVPRPANTQAATARLASTIPADGFSRGSELPIVPSEPTLFQRAGVEMLCENIAALVVDSETEPVFRSSDIPAALTQMLDSVMGYPPEHPQHAAALQILQEHFDAARKESRANATQALRSTFVLACEAPSMVAQGL